MKDSQVSLPKPRSRVRIPKVARKAWHVAERDPRRRFVTAASNRLAILPCLHLRPFSTMAYHGSTNESTMGGTYRGTFGPPRIGTRPDQPWTKGEDLHQRRSFRMRHKNRSSTLKEKYAVDRKEPSKIKFCWNAKHAAIRGPCMQSTPLYSGRIGTAVGVYIVNHHTNPHLLID